MSTTDTATRSQATKTDGNGPGDPPTKRQQAASALESLYAWANENEVPTSMLLEVLQDAEGLSSQHDKSLPPFHTSVVWADIFTPEGTKLHVVARAGSTTASIMDNMAAISGAFNTLCLEYGYLSADRLPKSREEIDATKAVVATKLAGSQKAKATTQAASPQGSTSGQHADVYEHPKFGLVRDIKAESVFHGVTDSGNPFFTVKGFPWKRFGVRCWPDSGQVGKLAGVVNLDTWEIGVTIDFATVDVSAVIRVKDDGKPDKVVDWIGPDVLELAESDPT